MKRDNPDNPQTTPKPTQKPPKRPQLQPKTKSNPPPTTTTTTTTTKQPKNNPKSGQTSKKSTFEEILDEIEERPKSGIRPTGPTGHPSRVLERVKFQFPEVHEKLVVVASKVRTDALKKILEETLRAGVDEFVGPAVSLFSRRHIPVVQSMDYLVCDRGNGLEFFLFICEEGVYIIDKKFFFYTLECTGFDVFSTKKGETTFLEGEFIRDKNKNRIVYYITDAVQINGHYCATATFTDRLNLVIEVLGARTDKSTPFEFNKKRFYPKTQLPQLLQKHIQQNPTTGGWYYQDEKRHHRAGGLLFKPNEPYPLVSSKHTFGRKFQNSVYFSAKKKISQNCWVLSVATEYGDTEFRQVPFPEQDEIRLVAELAKSGISGNSGNSGIPIIECVYDSRKAEWRYVGLKPFRQRPSKVRDVLETMTVMAEGLTLEELSYRVPRMTADDNWLAKHVKTW